MRSALLAAGLLLALPGAAAFACGYCIEDRIAAVYDHAVVLRAMDLKHDVAFFALEGKFNSSDRTRREILDVAESTDGVDRGSARVSMESATLSVAFDPVRTSASELQTTIGKKLSPSGISFGLLRVMDKPGNLEATRGPEK